MWRQKIIDARPKIDVNIDVKFFVLKMLKMQNKTQKMHIQKKNQVPNGVFSGVLDLEHLKKSIFGHFCQFLGLDK